VALAAAPPPELVLLQQSYDKAVAQRVTAPFEAAVTTLNAKYLPALEAAVKAAKAAGKLDAVLAIEADKVATAARQPPPDVDDEKTPEALKKLRDLYRIQYAKITTARAGNHQAFLPAYLEKLTSLEASLTKADRIDDAKEVLAQREILSSAPPSTLPEQAPRRSGPQDASPPARATKGNLRAAAEWVRSINGVLEIEQKGRVARLEPGADLPKGSYSIYGITLDSRNGCGPVNAEGLRNLVGLGDLKKLFIDSYELTDEDLAFVATLTDLQAFGIAHDGAFRGSLLAELGHIKGLSYLTALATSVDDVAIAELPKLKALTSLGLGGCPVTDAAIPSINRCAKITTLWVGATQITGAGLSALTLKLDRMGCNMAAGAHLSELMPSILKTQRSLTGISLEYDVSLADVLALQMIPKLVYVDCSGILAADGVAGFAELHGLEVLAVGALAELDDDGLRTVAKMKKLKRLDIRARMKFLSEGAVAAFRKERPAVELLTE
jgi:hypothetical protein